MQSARSYDDWDSQALYSGQQPHLKFAATDAAESPPAAEVKGSKRSRQTYSKYQTAVLETVFRTSKYIVRNKRQQMSAELDLTERQIKIWFQNRRMKEKKCHKDVPRVDVCGATGRPTAMMAAAGYADDYAAGSMNNNDLQQRDERGDFAGNYQDPTSKSLQDDCDFGVYDGGYDDVQATPELDPYTIVKHQQQWPAHSGTVDFHQNFYDNCELNQYQRLPTMTAHHHNILNSQVADYYPPQLQATHGY